MREISACRQTGFGPLAALRMTAPMEQAGGDESVGVQCFAEPKERFCEKNGRTFFSSRIWIPLMWLPS
jgi:hypothetical protein